jgi:hypothetical protein
VGEGGGGKSNYWEKGFMYIYAAAGYFELFLSGVLILSRKMAAWCLLEILFHSYLFPFHRPFTNVVLVTATKKLTDILTDIRSQRFHAAKKSHTTEHDFRPTVLTEHIMWLIPVALRL